MKRLVFKFFALLAVFCICVLSVTFAQEPNPSEPALVNLPDWLQTNWTIVALAVSETMAFLPAKFAGIAKAVFSVVGAIFGKRSSKS
jgi:hypothetical protein